MDQHTVDILLGAAAGAVAKEIAQGSVGLVKRNALPLAKHVGTLVAPIWNALARQVQGQSVTLLFDAAAVLEDSEAEPVQIPPRLLIPILQRGGLVEPDNPLRERWVNLLANAGDAARQPLVLPAFPGILEQLSALDVGVLDKLYVTKGYHKNADGLEGIDDTVSLAEAANDLNAGVDDLMTTMANLERQNLIIGTYPASSVRDAHSTLDMVFLRITPFGARFTRACRNDRPKADA